MVRESLTIYYSPQVAVIAHLVVKFFESSSMIYRSTIPDVIAQRNILILGTNNCRMAVQTVRNIGRLAANSCYFFLCDMQEKFRPTIRYYPEIITVADKMVSIVVCHCNSVLNYSFKYVHVTTCIIVTAGT